MVDINKFIRDYIDTLSPADVENVKDCPWKEVIAEFIKFSFTSKDANFWRMKNAITAVFEEEGYSDSGRALLYEMAGFLKNQVIDTLFTSTKLKDYYIFNEKVFKVESNSNTEPYNGTYSDIICRGTIDEHCFQILSVLLEFGSYKKEKIDIDNLKTFYILQKLDTEDSNLNE